jgi:hypothetical protein
MLNHGASARTAKRPGVAYIAATTVSGDGPPSAATAVSPATSAMSSAPAASSGTFSALPLVCCGATASPGSTALIAAAKAAP